MHPSVSIVYSPSIRPETFTVSARFPTPFSLHPGAAIWVRVRRLRTRSRNLLALDADDIAEHQTPEAFIRHVC